VSKVRQARGIERRWTRGHREEQLELGALEHAIAGEYRLAAGLAWSKAEKTALADELLGAIVHVTAAEYCTGPDRLGLWDKQRGLLENHPKDLVLWSLDFHLATHRKRFTDAVASAKHYRSQGDEAGAQRQDGYAREADDTMAKLGHHRHKVDRLGIPAEVIAAVDKRIPRATPELRAASDREAARVRAERDRAGDLVERFHAAEAAAGLPPQTCALETIPADVVALVDSRVAWDDSLIPDGWGLFHDWLAQHAPAGERAPR
jgi:hypothetical protein